MSYEKQTWQTGEVITEQKLNHMEDGIAMGGILFVHLDDTEGALDKTWQQIHDDARSKVVFIDHGDDDAVELELVQEVYTGRDNKYYVMAYRGHGASTYVTDSADGYPVPDSE